MFNQVLFSNQILCNMKKCVILLVVICTFLVSGVHDGLSQGQAGSRDPSMNFIKVNLTAPLIKNYSLQYERVLSRNFSAGLSVRFMPETGLPYTNRIIDLAEITDPDEKDVIENLMISNYAITPEVRYYMGKKKYGTGFYLSLFYRYASFSMANDAIDYEPEEGDPVDLDIEGDVTSHTGGFMIGSQWALGRYMCLDFWILGPHFGISSGKVNALSSEEMTLEDQQDIEDEIDDALNDADIPMFDYTVTTSADRVIVDFDGPWAGIRFGLSLGVKF